MYMTIRGFRDSVCSPHTPNCESQQRERGGQGNNLRGYDRADRQFRVDRQFNTDLRGHYNRQTV